MYEVGACRRGRHSPGLAMLFSTGAISWRSGQPASASGADEWSRLSSNSRRFRSSPYEACSLAGGPWHSRAHIRKEQRSSVFVIKFILFRHHSFSKDRNGMGNLITCRDPGSNWGPPDLQSDALPTELSRLKRVSRKPLLLHLGPPYFEGSGCAMVWLGLFH